MRVSVLGSVVVLLSSALLGGSAVGATIRFELEGSIGWSLGTPPDPSVPIRDPIANPCTIGTICPPLIPFTGLLVLDSATPNSAPLGLQWHQYFHDEPPAALVIQVGDVRVRSDPMHPLLDVDVYDDVDVFGTIRDEVAFRTARNRTSNGLHVEPFELVFSGDGDAYDFPALPTSEEQIPRRFGFHRGDFNLTGCSVPLFGAYCGDEAEGWFQLLGTVESIRRVPEAPLGALAFVPLSWAAARRRRLA